MQFSLIEAFITIVEKGSFSAAAEKLFISQPALSQQIKKLEKEIGVKLFDRSKHNAELTDAGRLFLEKGKQILEIYDRFIQQACSMEQYFNETVHFGISPFYSRHYLPKLLSTLIKDYPSLHFEVMEDYSSVIEGALLDGKLDFCMVPLNPKNPAINYVPVYTESIMLAVPKDSPVNKYAVNIDGVDCIDLKYVKDEPFVALKPVQKFFSHSQQLCQKAGFSPKIVCQTMNWDALTELVSAGQGVGLVVNLCASQTADKSSPCYYHLIPEAQRIYSIAYRADGELSPAAHKMIEIFQNIFREI